MPGGMTRLGERQVEMIEAATSVFRRWDNEFGGGLRRSAVVGQLSEVGGLLEGPFRDEQAGRRLFSAVADLAQLAGFSSAEPVFACSRVSSGLGGTDGEVECW
jgi:hypothetical protein